MILSSPRSVAFHRVLVRGVVGGADLGKGWGRGEGELEVKDLKRYTIEDLDSRSQS